MDSDSLCNSVSQRLESTQTTCPAVFGKQIHPLTLQEYIVYSNTGCLITGLEYAEICPTLKGFNFTSWDPTNEDLMGLLQSPTKRKHDEYQVPHLPVTSEDHAFDMDAIPETFGGDESLNETHLGMEDIDEDDGIDRHRNGEAQLNPVPILARNGKELGLVELKDHLSKQEYSYFNSAVRSAWAGPLHWRLNKPGQKGLSAHNSIITDLISKNFIILADANREVKKKRRKDALLLNFEDIPNFSNEFNPARNTSKLTHATLIQWLPEKITLPEDLHYGLKEFSQ